MKTNMTKPTTLRGKIEKIIWRHYKDGSALNVEELLDEAMPAIEQEIREARTEESIRCAEHEKKARNDTIKEFLEGKRCLSCGKKMKPKMLTDICPKCWEEN